MRTGLSTKAVGEWDESTELENLALRTVRVIKVRAICEQIHAQIVAYDLLKKYIFRCVVKLEYSKII